MFVCRICGVGSLTNCNDAPRCSPSTPVRPPLHKIIRRIIVTREQLDEHLALIEKEAKTYHDRYGALAGATFHIGQLLALINLVLIPREIGRNVI